MGESNESSSTFNINLITGYVTSAPASNDATPQGQTTRADTWPAPPPSDVPSSSKTFVGKAKPPRKIKAKEMEKNSDEYLRRRQRNNVAVKKSREKTREKSAYTLQKVEQLKAENEQLESKISILTKELGVLKDLFMDHARGFCAGGNVNLLSSEQLETVLGCKVIKNDVQPCSSGAASTNETESSKSGPLSYIEPLINAAEIELMSMDKNEKSNSGNNADVASSSGAAASSVANNYS